MSKSYLATPALAGVALVLDPNAAAVPFHHQPLPDRASGLFPIIVLIIQLLMSFGIIKPREKKV